MRIKIRLISVFVFLFDYNNYVSGDRTSNDAKLIFTLISDLSRTSVFDGSMYVIVHFPRGN